MPRFVSIGECIVELSGDMEAGYRFGIAGTAPDMAKRLRGQLGPDWSVDLFTALGDDVYSQRIVDDVAASGVGAGKVLKVAGRTVGLSLVGDLGSNGPLVTNWRGLSAARLMAESAEILAAAVANADAIFVSAAAFAILVPRARGRLLKALYRAREAGARIVLYPLEWPELWTSKRVLGSALNSIATIADIVFTASAGERSVFGDADAESVAGRYRDWGVEEVLVRQYDRGIFLSIPSGGRWIEADTRRPPEELNAAYLAARLAGVAPLEAAERMPRPNSQ